MMISNNDGREGFPWGHRQVVGHVQQRLHPQDLLPQPRPRGWGARIVCHRRGALGHDQPSRAWRLEASTKPRVLLHHGMEEGSNFFVDVSWDGDMAAPKRRWIACTSAHHCAMHSVCGLAARPSCCGCRASARRGICSSVSLDTNSDSQNYSLWHAWIRMKLWHASIHRCINLVSWCLLPNTKQWTRHV